MQLASVSVLPRGMFLGEAYLSRKQSGFSMGAWFASASSGNVKPHGHIEPHFMFALSGEYQTRAEGRRPSGLPLLIYNPAYIYHSDRFLSPRSSFFSVSIDPVLAKCAEALQATRTPTLLGDPAAIAVAMRLMGLCVRWQDDADLEAESLSLELVGNIAPERTDRHVPRWVKAACDRMSADIAGKFRIADLVHGAGVHPVHFARTFRAAMRCTPGEYLRSLRLQRSVQLLTTSRVPLSTIANDCGFADQAHLTRRFKAAFGVSPAVFRRNAA